MKRDCVENSRRMGKKWLALVLVILSMSFAGLAYGETIVETREERLPDGSVVIVTTTTKTITHLTAENSDEFAAILNSKDTYEPLVKDFVEKYKYCEIEFDGYIYYMDYNVKYKTRVDIMLLSGDYAKENLSGPLYRFYNVNIRDLHLTGNVPEYIGEGDNIHVTATIESYNPDTGIIELKPVSVEYL